MIHLDKMPRKIALTAVLLLALGLWTAPADAQAPAPAPAPASAPGPANEAVAVRTGNHADFGRIVFDAPPRARYRLTREGNQVTVTFADDVALGRPGKDPRNVSGLSVAGPRAVFTVPAGTRISRGRSPTAATCTSKVVSLSSAPACGRSRRSAAVSSAAGHLSRSTTAHTEKTALSASTASCWGRDQYLTTSPYMALCHRNNQC